jgi:hypothetical protein
MQELDEFIREELDYYASNMHTCFPGVVVVYDASKRRATIQPSIKRRKGNKEYVNLPLLIDVPVKYPGTKKFTIHFPLEKGDEVAVFFSERALEVWKETGMDKIEDPDPRRFSLTDAFCTPGLHPVEFIAATSEKALEVIHKTAWDGDIIDHFIMDDDQVDFVRLQDTKDSYHWHLDKDQIDMQYNKDENDVAHLTINADQTQYTWKKSGENRTTVIMDDDKIDVKFKEKAEGTFNDDHINFKTEKCSVDMTAQKIVATNSIGTLTMDTNITLETPGNITLKAGGTIHELNNGGSRTLSSGGGITDVGPTINHN